MTTPQLTFCNQTGKHLAASTADSIYCADCLCGRHFETVSREWICPECNRHIVIDWGNSEQTKTLNQPTNQSASGQEAA
jgi:Zn finger protein HypA/HybF involved in hydrogenase expression